MLSEPVGFDAGKVIKGRKRFLTVDTLGLGISSPSYTFLPVCRLNPNNADLAPVSVTRHQINLGLIHEGRNVQAESAARIWVA